MIENIQNKRRNGLFQNGSHLEPEVKLKLTLRKMDHNQTENNMKQ